MGFSKATAASIREHACIGPRGELFCFCHDGERSIDRRLALLKLSRKQGPNYMKYFHTCPHLEPHDQCNFWLLATDLDAAGYPRDQIPKDTKHSVNLPFFWPSELAEDQASSAMGWGVSGPAAVAKGQTRLSFGTQPRVAKEEDDDVIVVTQSARESSKRRRRTDPEEASEAGENEATVQALKKKVKELEHKVKTLQTKLANLGQASLGSNLDSE